MTLDEILARARAQYAKGVKPCRERLGVHPIGGVYREYGASGCCGLGAALIGLPAGRDLGLTYPLEAGFGLGFDGGPLDPHVDPAWYAAGRALAKEVGLD